ncbi:MAG TPA: pyridoxamine 5'-phosphate oxidase family protein [Candidatus Saccharimonadia bacterium]|nr:pyridoxamine 5'-phosphate oxidase family protein [Candidatus Saccharimonadia bacterium]
MPISFTESRDHILAFLNEHPVGVLATVSKAGQPHAAAVYVTCDQLLNVFFITKQDTQKNYNLLANAHAALTVYDAYSLTTVQLSGRATEVLDVAQRDSIFNQIWNAALRTSQSGVPPTTRLTAGGYTVYKLSADSARLGTFTQPSVDNYDHIFETITTPAV